MHVASNGRPSVYPNRGRSRDFGCSDTIELSPLGSRLGASKPHEGVAHADVEGPTCPDVVEGGLILAEIAPARDLRIRYGTTGNRAPRT